jgi:threonine aldolase
MTPADRATAFRAATRHLRGHGPPDPRAMLRILADEADEPADVYGEGAAIEALERDVAERFGKPAAVFVPSGTMAQQVALRIAADARGCRTVAFHPTCHLEIHEQRGYEHLHGLRARLVGARHRPILRSDLDAIAEPLAALLLELPQREIGAVCPPWDEVEAQAAWCRERGVALHLDGARIWETTPFYGRSLAELAAPFDTVYVSFYKILGGIAGAALLGDAATIAHARVWIRRLGGNLVSMYPMVLSARRGLREHLPRIPAYVERARAVARILVSLGVRVNPDPPHTNQLHAFFPADPERLLDASAAVALERGVALIRAAAPTEVPGHCRSELVLGDAADAIPDDELEDLLRELLSRARGPSDIERAR